MPQALSPRRYTPVRPAVCGCVGLLDRPPTSSTHSQNNRTRSALPRYRDLHRSGETVPGSICPASPRQAHRQRRRTRAGTAIVCRLERPRLALMNNFPASSEHCMPLAPRTRIRPQHILQTILILLSVYPPSLITTPCCYPPMTTRLTPIIKGLRTINPHLISLPRRWTVRRHHPAC